MPSEIAAAKTFGSVCNDLQSYTPTAASEEKMMNCPYPKMKEYVVHRVAASNEVAGKCYAMEIFKRIEDFSKLNNVFSIKIDTNFNNSAMLHILKKLDYQYCGKVYFRGSERLA